jgi:hypothetical protein
MVYGKMNDMNGTPKCFVSDFALWDEEEEPTVVESWSPALPPLSGESYGSCMTTGEYIAIAHSEGLEVTGTEWTAVSAAVEVAA